VTAVGVAVIALVVVVVLFDTASPFPSYQ